MAEPMKIRATLKGDMADVRVLMGHPMETGQRKDSTGKLIPLHFIQEVTVKLNGKTVIEGQISQAISRNPVFSFRVKGAKSGDKVEISWLDNKGDTNRTEAAIA
ncbi:MAG: thiosulfate oxidation carrier complex protein SoxZ [Betaproteobacteria bacterium]|nr:MAG: thiosulfate oxidation carrier complex protein SoxZ [Betaproteobacteria bacterium]